VVTANALQLNPVLMASVNSAAGVMGKMISILSIAVAVAATGMTTADEGRLFPLHHQAQRAADGVDGNHLDAFAYVFSRTCPRRKAFAVSPFAVGRWPLALLEAQRLLFRIETVGVVRVCDRPVAVHPRREVADVHGDVVLQRHPLLVAGVSSPR